MQMEPTTSAHICITTITVYICSKCGVSSLCCCKCMRHRAFNPEQIRLSSYAQLDVNRVTDPTAQRQVHAEEPAGDVLIFMTGQDEIEALERLLQAHVASQLTLPGASNPDPQQQQQLQLMVVSIFSAMPPEQQLKVCCLEPSLDCGAVSVGPMECLSLLLR